MLPHIIIGTDGSEASDRMIECVKGLRRGGSSEAVLTHVFNVWDVDSLYGALQQLMLPRLEKQRAAPEEVTEAKRGTKICWHGAQENNHADRRMPRDRKRPCLRDEEEHEISDGHRR